MYIIQYLFILILFSDLVSNEIFGGQHIKYQALQTDKEENKDQMQELNVF